MGEQTIEIGRSFGTRPTPGDLLLSDQFRRLCSVCHVA